MEMLTLWTKGRRAPTRAALDPDLPWIKRASAILAQMGRKCRFFRRAREIFPVAAISL
jgi:hypothetical protein